MRRWVRWALLGSTVLFGLAADQAVRWSRLAKRGAGLVRIAEAFPKAYVLAGRLDGPIVALGDSTALGVGAARVEETIAYRIAAGLGRRRVENLGVSGARIADLRRVELPSDLSRAVVVVSVSANDATRGTALGAFEADLTWLLDALQKRGAARVALTTTPNFLATPALPFPFRNVVAGRARALSAVVRRVAARYRFVRVADLDREGTLTEGQYAADEFHPNDDGYRAWTEIVARAAREE